MSTKRELKEVVKNLHEKLGMSYKFMADNTNGEVSVDKIHRLLKYEEMSPSAEAELSLFIYRVTSPTYIEQKILIGVNHE